jgi:hypothetical protein
MKIFEILTEAPKGLPPTIKPIKVPAFPEMPQQDGELGAGSQAGPTKDGGKYLSGSQGKFIWDTQGNPSKWQAPNFGGMSQTVDMKTGDITVILQQGGLNVSGVYDKTGKIKQGQGQASYDMGIAKASTGPQGNSITVRGGSPEQDQTVKTEAGDLRSTIDAYKQSFIKKTPPESWLPDETYREQLDNAIKKYGNNAKKLVAYIRSDNDFMLWFAKLPERDYLKKDAMAIIRPTVSETATAGSTSSGNMATVANPISANAKIKRDKNGVPMAPQKKNADGTAKNALELGNNLMGGATVKR